MRGRLESALKYEAKTRKLLDGRERYLQEYYYSLSASKEATTIYVYIRQAITFNEYLKANIPNFSIRRIRKVDIDRYMDSVKYTTKKGKIQPTSDSRMAAIWSSIHTFIQFLAKSGYIQTDIMLATERPKIKNPTHRTYLTTDEIRMVIKSAEEARENAIACHVDVFTHYHLPSAAFNEIKELLILRILVETGMRVTALVETNVEDLDLKAKTLRVIDKRGKENLHPLSDDTIELFEEYMIFRHLNFYGCEEYENAIFFSLKSNQQQQTRISARGVNHIIEKHTKNIDKHITAHKFRSTYATNLYQKTGDIYFVKECMGHNDVSTTQIYVEPDSASKERALDIMSEILKTD